VLPLTAHAHNPSSQALVSFPAISRFVIPRQSLCANLLTLTLPPLYPNQPPLLLLSYPLCLTSPKYPRNEFIFNFSLILSEPTEIDVPSYKSILLKLSHLMLSLEEQSLYLSSDPSAPNTGPIYAIIETLMSDLNNYCECMIPIDGSNTLHLKLFPTLPSPPPVKAWHVPIFTVHIGTLLDENWDLTMQRIIPFINGVNSLARIAALADADPKLTKKCIKHLLYYGCILLLDIFSFGNIYAPTAEFTNLIATDLVMQKECARYTNIRGARSHPNNEEAIVDGSFSRSLTRPSLDSNNMASSASQRNDDDEESVWPLTSRGTAVDGVAIVQLFAAMRQGVTVREWYAQNADQLANIDLRRFVTFGVIKGFLYRVHRYAFRSAETHASKAHAAGGSVGGLAANGATDVRKSDVAASTGPAKYDEEEPVEQFGRKVLPYIDGTHCFDEICTELEISERELVERLKSGSVGDVAIICR
jgi:nitrogen permease regulator 2-like protein